MSDSISGLLGRLSRDELRAFARAAEIRGRSTMTKEQLIAALQPVLQPPPKQSETVRASMPSLPDLSDARRRRISAGHRFEWMVDPRRSCTLRTIEGFSCGLPAIAEQERCALHGGVDISDLAVPAAGHLGADTWPALIRHLLLASYDNDALGLDPVVSEMIWHIANFLYFEYFRVEVEGIENVPTKGAGVLVSNHAGAFIPYDGMMLQLAVVNEAALPRRVRVVGTEILNLVPFLSHLYRKAGAAFASKEDARWVLNHGYLLGAFPEGVPAFQKPHAEAYQLRRFGRGGFAALAIEAGAPIIPVAIVGSEDVHPALFSSRRLAQLFKLFFPQQRVEEIGVFLNPIPLPVKWRIRFLEPIEMPDPGAPTDRLTVLEIAEQTREVIQRALDDMLEDRGSVF
ncbi:MAG: 1-acyl-sn-glycerol-3-phosphate acyltransferase [Acidimicrobiia bacterium]|nr:1-acyl-sn-glycerol-3-phosphate acyltransferase [Acidimicrobiia bacterium]